MLTSPSSPPCAPPPGPGTMRGTWKKSPSRRGAFASASSSGSEGARLVGARRAVERHRVGHRLDVAGVERAQGVHVFEDGAQIAGHARDLVVGQPQAREQRQLANFVGGDP